MYNFEKQAAHDQIHSRSAALLSTLLLAPLWFGAAATTEVLPSITVNGAGSVKGRPDVAIVSAGIFTQAELVPTALAQDNKGVAKILVLAQALGIAEADVQTEDLSVFNVCQDTQDEDQLQAVIGCRVSNPAAIRVRRLDQLGDLMERLSAVGGDAIGTNRFGVSDPETLLREARRRAVADALAKVVLYAETAGVALGPVVRIAEAGNSLSDWHWGEMAMMKAFDPVVLPASLEFGAAVAISFAIGKSG